MSLPEETEEVRLAVLKDKVKGNMYSVAFFLSVLDKIKANLVPGR